MKNRKLLIILFVLGMLLLLGMFALGKQMVERTRIAYSTALVYFTSTTFGFEVKAPENWIFYEFPDGTGKDKDFVMVVRGDETLFLQIYRYGLIDTSITELEKWANQKNNFSGISVLEPYHFVPELDGYLQEHTFIYESMMIKGTTLHCYDVLKTNESDHFLFQLCEKDANWDEKQEEFWEMLQSIRFD
ncbi:MAG: hypothetical protein CVU39_22680 [Chloroflexi bacterium HGW-Chloroflexi-10]|nr:MAG: hypothetical protein CVU39_22680 [Chloroflexi bacterium HGW-Chloroflexi-10]